VDSSQRTNLFSLDECRGRSVAKKGPSPLASIRQVFYIGLMRNCRGSPVNSCQCGISFVRRLSRRSDSCNDSESRGTRRPNIRAVVTCASLMMLHEEAMRVTDCKNKQPGVIDTRRTCRTRFARAKSATCRGIAQRDRGKH